MARCCHPRVVVDVPEVAAIPEIVEIREAEEIRDIAAVVKVWEMVDGRVTLDMRR